MAYQHRDGRWVAVWTDQDGRRRSRRFETRRLAELAESQQKRNRELVQAGLTSWNRIREREEGERTIDVVISLVERDMLERGRTAAYVREFVRCARRVLGTQLDRSVRDLDPDGVVRCVRGMDRITARGRNAYLVAAKTLASYAVKRRWIDDDPLRMVSLEPVPLGGVRRKTCIDPAAFLRLVDDRLVRESGRRVHYLVRFLTGIRETEARRLRRRDIRLVSDLVAIELPGSATKTGQPRIIPLPAEVGAEVFQRFAWMQPDDLLWPTLPQRQTFQRDCRRAGMPEAVSPAWVRLTWDVWLDELRIPLLDQMLLAGRTGRGSATISAWTYQDLAVALPRLAKHVEDLWRWIHERSAAQSPDFSAARGAAPALRGRN